jgi:NAD(P)-dependent dehydrogenase (short-subunit alcohol dehydrogenase family)
VTHRFAGRRALVTGASRGIGAAVAARLAAEGADVAIVARTREHHEHLDGSLVETAARIEGHGRRAAVVVADMTDADDRARVVAEAEDVLGGSIDVLVNNAAAAMYAPVATMPLKRRRILFEVNALAPLDLAQAVVPEMVERGAGWIVNLTSATARPGGANSTMALYGASKAALNRLTVGLAQELAGTGVRVNAIEPRAAVLTEGAAALVGDTLTDDLIESLEAMTEAVVALCDCPRELTGRICVSLDLIDELGLTVLDLDGAHPAPVRPEVSTA